METKKIIEKLEKDNTASGDELLKIISDSSSDQLLFDAADRVRRKIYGTDVFIRGLVEISNYCKNNCIYCGIRRDNKNVRRYRLSPEEIFSCCQDGYDLGFRTFVIQGGEDSFYSDELLEELIKKIKAAFPDCAVTLSLGERSEESFRRLFKAGADRYLLRHETADPEHYRRLHPAEMSYDNRINCLKLLKKIGYQTGAGFMVGSPYQTRENLVKDLMFIKELMPEMVGIGPFISQKDTPFCDFENGTLRDTLVMVALTRLIHPHALIPSTTALGTIHPQGRELGLKAGANVVMPNLSPTRFRKLYSLYDNKICTGDESAQCRKCLETRVKSAGYNIVTDRGDFRA
ncbi:MAG: [FeFe] hydrogenase H-cluster radical SAM maturase HydE [Porcipelethomonas sp.]